MRIITTTSDNEISSTRESTSGFAPDIGRRELNVLNIYPSERFQTFIGFGGAVTDSAGWVYAQLPGERRREFIEMCYGPTGLAYTLGRTHIDSCDFSTEMYCADGDESDDSLRHFDMDRCGKYVFPLLDDIMRERRELRLVLAPWSPPAYMKDNASRTGGGHLKSEYRGRWARYICRYAAELERRGYKIFALSAQNEPNAVQTWDSCLYSPADERDFIRGYLSPELRTAGLDGVKIIVWDHNKEMLFDRVDEICSDPGANAAVGAAGFHWYSGDHFDALRLVRRKYPDKLLIFTEGFDMEPLCRRFRDADWCGRKFRRTSAIIDGLADLLRLKTSDALFDAYIGQSMLDNILRGGKPEFLGDRLLHVFGRRHGDLERDYNDFALEASHFSEGDGNFRDVCQNRRSDVLFWPEVGKREISEFMELLQLDGYGPLEIHPGLLILRPELKDECSALLGRGADAVLPWLERGLSAGELWRRLHMAGLEADTLMKSCFRSAPPDNIRNSKTDTG